VVRVGSADSDPGQVLRHVGAAFVLGWADGEEGEYSPGDIVPDPDLSPAAAPSEEGVASPPIEATPADDMTDWRGRYWTCRAMLTGLLVAVGLDDDPSEEMALVVDHEVAVRAGHFLADRIRQALAPVSPPADPPVGAWPALPAPEIDLRQFAAGMCSALGIQPPAVISSGSEFTQGHGIARRSLHSDIHQAEVIRAILPDGAELMRAIPGWRLEWPPEMLRTPIEATDLRDLMADLMADAAPPPRATGCDRGRIEVLEAALDASREEVGQLRARLAVATSPHRTAPSSEVALRAALDLIAALRPT
jgi:hypothetical protein